MRIPPSLLRRLVLGAGVALAISAQDAPVRAQSDGSQGDPPSAAGTDPSPSPEASPSPTPSPEDGSPPKTCPKKTEGDSCPACGRG